METQSQQVFENSFRVEKELSNQCQVQVPSVFVCAVTIPHKDLLIMTRAHHRIILFLWFPTSSSSKAVTIPTLYLILNHLNNKSYFAEKITLKSKLFIFFWFTSALRPLDFLHTVLHPVSESIQLYNRINEGIFTLSFCCQTVNLHKA